MSELGGFHAQVGLIGSDSWPLILSVGAPCVEDPAARARLDGTARGRVGLLQVRPAFKDLEDSHWHAEPRQALSPLYFPSFRSFLFILFFKISALLNNPQTKTIEREI
jgi:hypothetical protein